MLGSIKPVNLRVEHDRYAETGAAGSTVEVIHRRAGLDTVLDSVGQDAAHVVAGEPDAAVERVCLAADGLVGLAVESGAVEGHRRDGGRGSYVVVCDRGRRG